MKMQRHEASFESKMDLTPLIDCVFQLILFFVLTTQITVQIEQVTLPFALEGKVEKPGLTTNVETLRINVRRPPEATQEQVDRRDGEIVFSGRVMNRDELQAELQKEVAFDAAPISDGGRGRVPEATKSGRKLSQLRVLIRCDREVRSEYLQDILEVCQKVSPAIYKIEVASMQPENES